MSGEPPSCVGGDHFRVAVVRCVSITSRPSGAPGASDEEIIIDNLSKTFFFFKKTCRGHSLTGACIFMLCAKQIEAGSYIIMFIHGTLLLWNPSQRVEIGGDVVCAICQIQQLIPYGDKTLV